MALVVSNLSYERKPWMLRDYLRDDMSSCSSNGFRSFPRKQCCVAVKNIIESETRKLKKPKKMLSRNQRVSSALQRASLAVINAVKLLPFNSTTTVTNSGGGRRFLPRSFSKKMFKRSFFWKKPSEEKDVVVVVVEEDEEECDEIERWISSCVSATEKYVPLDLSNDTSVTNISNFSNSNSNSNNSSDGKSSSECWSESTFTSDYLPNFGEKHVAKKDGGRDDDEEVVSKSVGGLVGEDSTQETIAVNKNNWCDEKAQTEHLSPISVMDFPNNDDGSESPFTLRVSRLKGTKERLMEKLGRFESLAAGLGLDPVNLESLISSTEMEDHSPKGSIQSCSTPSFILSSESETEVGGAEEEEDGSESQVNEEEEEDDQSQVDKEEKRVQHLLNIIKFKKANYKIECDNLLLSFLRENVDQTSDVSLLKSAEDWLNGHYDTLILGWEVKDKRQAYIRDMEERGRWPKDCKLEKEDVAIELGNEVLTTLIQEVILELC